MSGTSLDGVDLSLADYWKENGLWRCEPVFCKTYAYYDQILLLIKSLEDPYCTFLKFKAK